MSKKTGTVESTETTAEPKAETKNAPKFTAEQMKADALKLFGVTQSTYAGATHKLDGKYTVEEMKSHIDEWLKKEVK